MALVTIQIEPNQNMFIKRVYTNQATLKKMNLSVDKPVKLAFGNKSVDVFFSISTTKGNILLVSSDIAKELLLPNGIQLNMKNSGDYVQLGPILGVLIQDVNEKQVENPFGKLTPFAQEVASKSYSKGILPYFFTIKSINYQGQSISGWVLKNKKWHKINLPVPNVIYNRISSRKLEKKTNAEIEKISKEFPFVFFNSHFLNKWDVAQMLKPTPIRHIIPKTVLFKGIRTIKEMLNMYQTIYLKPTNGSLGRGIVKIQKKSGLFIVHVSRAQGPHLLTFKSLHSMFNYLKPRLFSEPYLVQQGLNLITLDKRPIDFRILVQKNERGIWAITSMVSRIANDQNFVSNLARGGTQGNLLETIKAASPGLSKKVSKKMFREHALNVAKYIEKSSNGNFVELGIDLALDKDGKIWLLEVNSKPSKTDDPKEHNGPRPSVTRLSNYVLYVSGYWLRQQKKYKQVKKR